MRSGFIRFSVAAFLHVPLRAQWLHYVTAGIPRTAGGKPNLTASALRTSDGKPDLSGIWLADSFRWNDLAREGTDAPMLPAASTTLQTSRGHVRLGPPHDGQHASKGASCVDGSGLPFKILQMPAVAVLFVRGIQPERGLKPATT